MEKGNRKKFTTLKLFLDQNVEPLPKFENKKQLANLKEFFICKAETIVATITIPTAKRPEIVETEVDSLNSFTELSLSQFRDLI